MYGLDASDTVFRQGFAATGKSYPRDEPEVPVHTGLLDHDLWRPVRRAAYLQCLCAPGGARHRQSLVGFTRRPGQYFGFSEDVSWQKPQARLWFPKHR